MFNSKGAASKLGYGLTWIRKLVRRGDLVAYVFDDAGQLTRVDSTSSLQGKDIYFKEEDLTAYQPNAKGRPIGVNKKKTSVSER